MARAFLFVLDSVGIGGAPDAAQFGDEGANTVGHIAAACAEGKADNSKRDGPLSLPHMERLGLGLACDLATGERPAGFQFDGPATGGFAAVTEHSAGKDTITGHWEIAGVPLQQDWGYFPNTQPAFPEALTKAIIERADIPGILGNKHASGTGVIEELGVGHVTSGKPIIYTSADSVIQIAAHEEFFGLNRLYDLCQTTRELADAYNIGRVIARPFIGKSAESFERTPNRRDYSVPPPLPTLLDRLEDDEHGVFAVGKIADIFSHRGVTDVRKAHGNDAMVDTTLQAMDDAADGDFVFTNFIDFDQIYGHRRDVAGYAACLERFDARLPEMLAKLRSGDMLILTADHGNDPTWHGTDHTRERVPVLIAGPNLPTGDLGLRDGFADIGATVAQHLGVAVGPYGKSLI
ncbi:MAG: phosphopentomutase [Ahrensia sp.]|nr:phosphopentomutase [Ahrensia sp.]